MEGNILSCTQKFVVRIEAWSFFFGEGLGLRNSSVGFILIFFFEKKEDEKIDAHVNWDVFF